MLRACAGNSTMPRRLLIVGIFLLAGALVNVVVAWRCAVGLRLGGAPASPVQGAFTFDSDTIRLYGELTRVRGAECIIWMAFYSGSDSRSGGPPDAPTWSRPPGTTEPSNHWLFIEDARGWPLLAFASGARIRPVEGTPYGIGLTTSFGIDVSGPAQRTPGVFLRTVLRDRTILPLRPLWPGFAINTALYAAAVWGLFVSIAAVCRRLRRWPGHCRKCGYDLTGLTGEWCPECGAAIGERRPACP